MSREELAIEVGVSEAAVGQWERGEVDPRKGKLLKLARVLGVTLRELQGYASEENITSVGEDSTKLKELSLRYHDARDKIEGLETQLRRRDADIEKLRAAVEQYKAEAEALRKKVFDPMGAKKKAKD